MTYQILPYEFDEDVPQLAEIATLAQEMGGLAITLSLFDESSNHGSIKFEAFSDTLSLTRDRSQINVSGHYFEALIGLVDAVLREMGGKTSFVRQKASVFPLIESEVKWAQRKERLLALAIMPFFLAYGLLLLIGMPLYLCIRFVMTGSFNLEVLNTDPVEVLVSLLLGLVVLVLVAWGLVWLFEFILAAVQ